MALAMPQRDSGEGARPLRGSLEPVCHKVERNGGQWDSWAGKEVWVPREMETEQFMLIEEWPPGGEALSHRLTEDAVILAPLTEKEARPRGDRSLAEGHTALKGVWRGCHISSQASLTLGVP